MEDVIVIEKSPSQLMEGILRLLGRILRPVFVDPCFQGTCGSQVRRKFFSIHGFRAVDFLFFLMLLLFLLLFLLFALLFCCCLFAHFLNRGPNHWSH